MPTTTRPRDLFLLALPLLSLLLVLAAPAATKLRLGVAPGLKYDPVALHVRPGEEVELLFDNVDEMMHNLVLVAPGSRLEIVEAAIALGAEGPARHYVPDSPKVLASTQVVLPGKKTTLTFTAPEKPGEYPYVCTFPGHGFLMKGVLFVAEERPAAMYALLAKAAEEAKDVAPALTPETSGKAIVHRTFMPGSSPAAIAVSLPGGHSYCWDAGTCRLRYAWRGGFIKKNGSFGRWRTLPTIEGRVYLREAEFPFRFDLLPDAPQPLPKFLGYRFIDGLPAFRHRLADATITEFLAKLPGKSGLTRHFTIRNAPADVLRILDTSTGVSTTCDKGTIKNGILRLTPKEATSFTLTQVEVPRQSPALSLSMDDLAASFNKRGGLVEGHRGRAWQISAGQRVNPAQPVADYDFSQGASLAAYIKLSSPKNAVPSLFGWPKGGLLRYQPDGAAFTFGAPLLETNNEEGTGLEAEDARFSGPFRQNGNQGFHGRGYLDFGSAAGQYVEWTVNIEKAGEHRLLFRYASQGKRPLALTIDGKSDLLAPPLPFSDTASWTTWKHQEAKVRLTPGKRLIRLTAVENTGPNVDRLEIIPPADDNLKEKRPAPPPPPPPEPVIDDTWHHVALTLDASVLRIYLDGELLRERPLRPGEKPEGPIILGSSGKHPHLWLDELHLYERPLALEEIRRLAGK